MKKIFSLIIALFTVAASFAQYPNQINLPTQYVKLNVLTNLGVPNDTFSIPSAVRKYPHIAIKGTNLYCWDTTLLKWSAITSGGPSGISQVVAQYGLVQVNDSTFKVDTTLISTRAWRQKGIDSVANLIPDISGKLDISDTTVKVVTPTQMNAQGFITRSGISATAPITYNSGTGVFDFDSTHHHTMEYYDTRYLMSVPSLQQVTDIGSSTTQVISASAFAAFSSTTGIQLSDLTLSYVGMNVNADGNHLPRIDMYDHANNTLASIKSELLTNNRTIQLPDASDTLANRAWVRSLVGGGGGSLSGLSDVNISSPSNLQLLQYQTGDSKWHNWTPNYLTGNQTITLSGDVTGSGATSISTTVGKINGVALSGLATGILKNTTATGVPSIAVAGDFPTLNQNTTGSAGSVANALTVGTGLQLNSGTTYNGSAARTISVNIDTGNISNFSTKVRSLFSGTAPITYSNGSIGISQATTSTNGYLSSTDWNTFNNKLSAMAIGGAVTSGTSGSILYVNSSGNLAQDNGNLFYDATNKRFGLGTTNPSHAFDYSVSGNKKFLIDSVGRVAFGGDIPGWLDNGGLRAYGTVSSAGGFLTDNNVPLRWGSGFSWIKGWGESDVSANIQMGTNNIQRFVIYNDGRVKIMASTGKSDSTLRVVGSVSIDSSLRVVRIDSTTSPVNMLFQAADGTIKKAAVPSGGGSGDMILASAQTVTGAKTFNDTKLLLNNVAGTFNGSFTNTNTANRVYTLKDANGTIAFTSDILMNSTDKAFLDSIHYHNSYLKIDKLYDSIANKQNDSTFRTKSISLIAGTNISSITKVITDSTLAYTINASGGGGSMAIGGTVTSGTAGSVLFLDGSGNLGQSNSDFYWDNTNKRLGFGTTAPSHKIDYVVSGTHMMTLDSIGRLSLGDDVPSWLDQGGIYATGTIVGGAYTVAEGGRINWGASSTRIKGAGDGSGNDSLSFQTEATPRLVIKDDGTATFYKSVTARLKPRVTSITSNATWSPSADTDDMYEITAQAAAATTISNPSGTPTDGQVLIIRIKDNGTARALTWSGSQWRASTDLALPSTTTVSKTMYLKFIYNSADTKWDLIALLNNF